MLKHDRYKEKQKNPRYKKYSLVLLCFIFQLDYALGSNKREKLHEFRVHYNMPSSRHEFPQYIQEAMKQKKRIAEEDEAFKEKRQRLDDMNALQQVPYISMKNKFDLFYAPDESLRLDSSDQDDDELMEIDNST